MKFAYYLIPAAAALTLAACGQATSDAGAAQAASAETPAAEAPIEFDAPSGAYTSESGHRYITFSYWHQGYSKPWIRWHSWDGVLNWDADNPENSSVSVTIDATSIDTGVDKFDAHMNSEDLFDTATHPQITFESTDVAQTGPNTGTMTGELTIKGVTKPATLDVRFNKGAHEERGGVYKLGFSASTSVNRSEFDLGYAVPIVGDEVDIVIEAEFQMADGSSE